MTVLSEVAVPLNIHIPAPLTDTLRLYTTLDLTAPEKRDIGIVLQMLSRAVVRDGVDLQDKIASLLFTGSEDVVTLPAEEGDPMPTDAEQITWRVDQWRESHLLQLAILKQLAEKLCAHFYGKAEGPAGQDRVLSIINTVLPQVKTSDL